MARSHTGVCPHTHTHSHAHVRSALSYGHNFYTMLAHRLITEESGFLALATPVSLAHT
jgi:hypothetical protein